MDPGWFLATSWAWKPWPGVAAATFASGAGAREFWIECACRRVPGTYETAWRTMLEWDATHPEHPIGLLRVVSADARYAGTAWRGISGPADPQSQRIIATARNRGAVLEAWVAGHELSPGGRLCAICRPGLEQIRSLGEPAQSWIWLIHAPTCPRHRA